MGKSDRAGGLGGKNSPATTPTRTDGRLGSARRNGMFEPIPPPDLSSHSKGH